MTDQTDPPAEPTKRSRKPLLLGALGAVVLGLAGFAVMYLDVFGSSDSGQSYETAQPAAGPQDIAFVPMPQVVISLGHDAENRHLRFTAQLEVESGFEGQVTFLLPRIADVLNTYLAALKAEDLEHPSALLRLRGQMLRRVQVVTGNGMVRDLLVTEFVLN